MKAGAEGLPRHIQVQPLDLPLLITEDLVGIRQTIQVNGETFLMEMPGRAGSGAKYALTGPEVVGDRDATGVLRDSSWGHGYQQGSVSQAEVHAVVISFELDRASLPAGLDVASSRLAGPDLDRLVAAATAWTQRWIDWLTALSSQSLHLDNPGSTTLSRHSANPLTWTVVDGTATPGQTSGQLIVVNVMRGSEVDCERAVDAGLFTYACARADAEEDVPLALDLRSNSHIASRRGERRLAIVESGTAAEAWLTKLLRLPPNHGQTLGGLVTSASTGGSLLADTKTAFVDLRNDAVHRGVVPDSVTTRRALEIADDLFGLAEAPLHQVVTASPRTTRPQRHDLVIYKAPAAPVPPDSQNWLRRLWNRVRPR